MITLQFGVVKKKRNSTYIPTTELTATQYAALKDGCSDHNPVFLLSNATNVFAFNYVKWDNWYYFVDDVVREHNQLVSVHCSLDVLATYKAEILQTNCFVAYSSVSGGSWLPDTRIPVLNDVSVSSASLQLPFVNTEAGTESYYLTVVGGSSTGALSVGGCTTYSLSRGQLKELIYSLSQENTQELNRFMNLDYSSPEKALEALSEIMASTQLWANAFGNATQCIRSCTWSNLSCAFNGAGGIYLGDYDTGLWASIADISPQKGTLSVAIPWQYSDWRRVNMEDVYLFLPFVGMVSLASENLVSSGSITINYSYTILDGNICYQVKAGSQIIGSYGGKACGEYPIGIIRGASSNEIATSLLSGAEKTIAVAAQGNVLNAGNVLPTAGQAVISAMEVKQQSMQKYPSCIGGIGGGASMGLPSAVVCFSVAHGSSCSPSEMAAVMGSPTMKPLTLSQCTGYCECVNAHVSVAASTDAINEIDRFINTGFYIE